ncbi:VOC family protein [Leeuwenhoekiella parthenopeia]|uniref:VOC family protein n=1 Tax=Leeuwenhoekiella parthenopeia TaxID=2890320 RepID=A0ABS8GWW5_9FLAO|nr:VOC family protein [Leeuwenhoekiella parthenopeia]MCC4213068.1 VOC family protein [Leeuwenhoekiella parthenopeia]
MKVQTIYVNLPVTDIEKTRAFWTKLGFQFNEDFCDENTLALELNAGTIYAMLLKKDKFSTFTDRPIADQSTTQVLIAIQVESKDKVLELVKLAIENGGTSYKEPADLGWMYYDTFADLDGHQWELMFTDMSKMEN